MKHCDLIIVGAGIMGLAHAYHASLAGMSVRVIERSPRAQGASTENFGMLAVIAQANGQQRDDALRALKHWQILGSEAGFTTLQSGCLIVAQHPQELDVLEEFTHSDHATSACRLLKPSSLNQYAPGLRQENLQGGLWSPDAWKVDQRSVTSKIALCLQKAFNVQFSFSTTVSEIAAPLVETSDGAFSSDNVIVCAGNDFSTLFPESFRATGVISCELQMLRTGPQPDGWQLKPFVLGGLSLPRYSSFASCTSLPELKAMQQQDYSKYVEHGIHVIVCQEADGSLTIGDSHAYSEEPTRDQPNPAAHHIDKLIMDELNTVIELPDREIKQRWCGHYAYLPDTDVLTLSPAENVMVVTATHGQGMTHSFAIAEKVIQEIGS